MHLLPQAIEMRLRLRGLRVAVRARKCDAEHFPQVEAVGLLTAYAAATTVDATATTCHMLLLLLLLMMLLHLLLLRQYCWTKQRAPNQYCTPAPPHLHPLLHARLQVVIWHQRCAGQQRPALGTGGVAEGQPLLQAAAFVSAGSGGA